MKRIRRKHFYVPLDDPLEGIDLQTHNISKLCQEDAKVKELVPIEFLEVELDSNAEQLSLWPASLLSTSM